MYSHHAESFSYKLTHPSLQPLTTYVNSGKGPRSLSFPVCDMGLSGSWEEWRGL